MDRDCLLIVPQTMHDTLYEACEVAKAGGHEIDYPQGLGEARPYLMRLREKQAEAYPYVIDPNGQLHTIPEPVRPRVAEFLEQFTFCRVVAAKLTKANHGDQVNVGTEA